MSYRDCIGFITNPFHNEGSCRVIYAFNQLLWMFGSLYIAIGAISVYARCSSSAAAFSAGFLGIFGILCAIFTVSNALHICLQLPTSQGSVKLQKMGHTFMLFGYAIALCLYSIMSQEDTEVRCWDTPIARHTYTARTELSMSLKDTNLESRHWLASKGMYSMK